MCGCCGSWTRCGQRRRQQGSKSSEFTIAIIILLPLSACRLNILDTDLGYRDYTSCPSYYLIVYLYICKSTLHFICGFVAQRFFYTLLLGTSCSKPCASLPANNSNFFPISSVTALRLFHSICNKTQKWILFSSTVVQKTGVLRKNS